MPVQVEKRAAPRLPIKLPFLYRPTAPEPVTTGMGWTHDLSEEGACLELPNRFAMSSTLRILFQTDQGGLDLSAAVVWTSMIRQKGEGVLHGVSFTEITPDRRRALRQLIHASSQSPHPAPLSPG